MPAEFLTIGQLARQLRQPEWKVRRIVDSLGVEIIRAGLYRLVRVSLLPQVEAALQRQSEPCEVEQCVVNGDPAESGRDVSSPKTVNP